MDYVYEMTLSKEEFEERRSSGKEWFENTIMALIIISSIQLAIEGPGLDADSPLHMPFMVRYPTKDTQPHTRAAALGLSSQEQGDDDDENDARRHREGAEAEGGVRGRGRAVRAARDEAEMAQMLRMSEQQAHSFSAVCGAKRSLKDRSAILRDEGLWNALLQIVDAALPIEIGSRYLRHNVRPFVRPR